MGHYRGPNIVRDSSLQIALDMSATRSYPGSGTSWYDLSGRDNHFTFSTSPSLQTLNGHTVWGTTGQVATGPASNTLGIDNNSGYTIFTCFKTLSGSSNGLFKVYSSTASANGRAIFVHPGWSNSVLYFDQGGCCNADQRITYSNSNIIGGTWTVAAFRSTVATRSIFYNGSLVTNTTTAAAVLNVNSTAVALNPSDESYNWNGQLANFYVYNRPLSDEEVIQNSTAMLKRFGL